MRVLDENNLEYRFIPGHPHLIISIDGLLYNLEIGEHIKPITRATGYVTLPHGQPYLTKQRHRLLAMCWKELPEGWESMEVNHINGVPGDDWPENLEWVTHSGNVNHAVETGLIKATDIAIADGNGNVTRVKGYTAAEKVTGILRATIAYGLVGRESYQKNGWTFTIPNLGYGYETVEEFWSYDIISGEVKRWTNRSLARRQIGLTPAAVRRELSENNGAILRPGYRISANKDTDWKKTISYKELRQCCDKVILYRTDGSYVEKPSYKAMVKYLKTDPIVPATTFVKYADSQLQRYRRLGLDVELEVRGVRYTIDVHLNCHIKRSN